MPTPLSHEDLLPLRQAIPDFDANPKYMYLAERKLLPQQAGIESFENPEPLTKLRRLVFGPTDKEMNLAKKQEQAMIPFMQEQQILAGLKAHQQMAMETAPPMGVAHQQYGIPFDPSQMKAGPTQVQTEQALLPDTFDIDKLQGGGLLGFENRGPGPGVSIPVRADAGRQPRTVDTYVHDEQAKMLPYQVAAMQPLAEGRTVIDEQGRAVPTQYATAMDRPRNAPSQEMTPEEFDLGLKQLESIGALPENVKAADIPRPLKPFPRQEGQALLNHFMNSSRQQGNDRTGVNRLAKAFYGRDFNDLPVGGKEQQDVMKRWSLMNPMAQQQVMLQAPVAADKSANLFDRKAFLETGELVATPGLTEGQARGKDVLHITDKNLEQVSEIEKATVSLDQIFDYSKRIITAKTPFDAGLQGAKYIANSNAATRMVPGIYDANMATYYDQVQALGNGLAKAFGGERGVLTNVDVSRWVNALPKPGDTIEVREQKTQALSLLAKAAAVAQRRAIAGDAGSAKQMRTEIHKQLDSLLKPIEAGSAGTSAIPQVKSDDDYNKLKSGSEFVGPDGVRRRKP